MAPFPIGTFVETFLDREKEDTKRLIRHEMESMLGPLVESLFGQLKAKFVDYLDAVPYIHQELQLVHEQDEQLINQHIIHDVGNVFDAHCQSLQNVHSIDANSQVNSPNHYEPALISIKEEINDPSNVQMFEPQQNSIHSSSSTHEASLFPQLTNPSTSIEFESSNTEMHQQSHIKDNEYEYDDDEEEECDCDECVYGSINLKEEDDDVQLIDDHELSPPVKRPRMDLTQLNNAGVAKQSPRQATEKSQLNDVEICHNKQILTLALQCSESNCFEIFVPKEHYTLTAQLKDHMWSVHSIGSFRCLLRNCKQSFDNSFALGRHIQQTHSNTIEWHCDKCTKRFNTHRKLSDHNVDYHQHGRLQCSYPSCTFTGEFRRKVYNHYTQQHKAEFVCQQAGCSYRTKHSTRLKNHERAHLGIEPYRCKWPNCHYSSGSQSNTMGHIKRMHFSSNTSHDATHLGKPKDYLEVVL